MTDYTELVKALRERALRENEWYEHGGDIIEDAADAIEALQAEVKRLQKEAEFSESSYDELSMQAAIQNALLAQQLPKRGEWIDGDARRVTARCSMCGHLRLGNGAEWANKHVHFCEVCGSRMGDEKA